MYEYLQLLSKIQDDNFYIKETHDKTTTHKTPVYIYQENAETNAISLWSYAALKYFGVKDTELYFLIDELIGSAPTKTYQNYEIVNTNYKSDETNTAYHILYGTKPISKAINIAFADKTALLQVFLERIGDITQYKKIKNSNGGYIGTYNSAHSLIEYLNISNSYPNIIVTLLSLIYEHSTRLRETFLKDELIALLTQNNNAFESLLYLLSEIYKIDDQNAFHLYNALNNTTASIINQMQYTECVKMFLQNKTTTSYFVRDAIKCLIDFDYTYLHHETVENIITNAKDNLKYACIVLSALLYECVVINNKHIGLYGQQYYLSLIPALEEHIVDLDFIESACHAGGYNQFVCHFLKASAILQNIHNGIIVHKGGALYKITPKNRTTRTYTRNIDNANIKQIVNELVKNEITLCAYMIAEEMAERTIKDKAITTTKDTTDFYESIKSRANTIVYTNPENTKSKINLLIELLKNQVENIVILTPNPTQMYEYLRIFHSNVKLIQKESDFSALKQMVMPYTQIIIGNISNTDYILQRMHNREKIIYIFESIEGYTHGYYMTKGNTSETAIEIGDLLYIFDAETDILHNVIQLLNQNKQIFLFCSNTNPIIQRIEHAFHKTNNELKNIKITEVDLSGDTYEETEHFSQTANNIITQSDYYYNLMTHFFTNVLPLSQHRTVIILYKKKTISEKIAKILEQIKTQKKPITDVMHKIADTICLSLGITTEGTMCLETIYKTWHDTIINNTIKYNPQNIIVIQSDTIANLNGFIVCYLYTISKKDADFIIKHFDKTSHETHVFLYVVKPTEEKRVETKMKLQHKKEEYTIYLQTRKTVVKIASMEASKL